MLLQFFFFCESVSYEQEIERLISSKTVFFQHVKKIQISVPALENNAIFYNKGSLRNTSRLLMETKREIQSLQIEFLIKACTFSIKILFYNLIYACRSGLCNLCSSSELGGFIHDSLLDILKHLFLLLFSTL